MKLIILIILTISPFTGNAQFARIYADSTELPFEYLEDEERTYFFKSMTWTMNHKNIKFDHGYTKVYPVTNRPDTIFYQYKFQNDDIETVDTFLTKLKPNRDYEFQYNICCGGFNFRNKNESTQEEIIVKFKNTDSLKYYRMSYGDFTDVISSEYNDTIPMLGRSPMVPNNFEIELIEIEYIQVDPHQDYLLKKTVLKFNFIPSNKEITEIIIDEKDYTIEMR